ncbi:unnamed protein product [Phaedon cochleariae]|uniref:Uncharacterized protein n=1 Tax=Phaedon cochleariae TaxID=80249 RepID=A0A9P0DH94_PHACE|nr:unnamed protein product [Phaedon cochleariae]
MPCALWFLLIFGIFQNSHGQGDSLRSALNVIDRRQRNMEDYDENEYGYTLERPEDIAFLKASSGYGPDRTYDRTFSNYLNDDKYDTDMNKRLSSSSFRERMTEEDNQKHMEEMAQNMLANMDSKGRYGVESEDYDEILRELYDKYRRSYETPRMYSSRVDKRYMYPRFGLDSAGLRKRTAYANDPYEDDTYVDENEEEYPTNYLRKRYYQRDNKMNRLMKMYSNPYEQSKRFPVAKRSSDYKEITHEHKRSTTKKQTDPKVEKELSNIFASAKGETTTTKPVTVQTTTKMNESENKTEVAPKEIKDDKKVRSINKEQFTPVAAVSAKPLQLKKKSIDWSDYFGLDRRKKSSEPNDLDKEWLIERYHKSIQMSKKRNAELPLSSFRNHDEPPKKEPSHKDAEERRIEEMDSKLQLMENKIVDDTLKYTGAHQGDNDPKEVQEIKDRVISRLAAAYSLEKMRNALGEYRLAIAKEKERLKNRRPGPEEEFFSEEKRTAVPRKQVIDKDREDVKEADNNIKCTDGDEDCHEQNYKTPNEIIESHFGTEECPPIQRACNEVASIVGEYGHVFESACSMHEMCLLCSNNSWFSPTRQCNSLFLAKAYDMCKDNLECQKEAQRSVRYLLEVNRSLHTDPSALNDCELSCPETDNVSETNLR